MALRSGSFGRRRSSGNLTSTIYALLRQQQAQEDQDIFDAWQNGGDYKGAKVTDSSLLAYIKQRRDGYAKNDADYDVWDNRLQQYGFSIDESKIGLAYSQGKVSAGTVAQFYKNALSKFPQDSEIYRKIAGKAADWAKSAAAAARGSAAEGVTKALNARLDKDQATIKGYNAIVTAIDQAARRAGLISGNQQVLDTLKPDELQRLLGVGVQDPFTGQMYHFSDWQHAAMLTYNAIGDAAAVYQQKGDQSAAQQQLDNQRQFATGTLVGMNAIDDRAQYEVAQKAWSDEIESAKGNPYAIAAANQKFAAQIERIKGNASSAGINPLKGANDPNFIAQLDNMTNALTTGKVTGPTPNDSGSSTGDAVDTAKAALSLASDLALLDTGRAIVGQSKPGGNYEPIPIPAGAENDPNLGLGAGMEPMSTNVNGTMQTVWMKGQPVMASVLLDQHGIGVTDLSHVTVYGSNGQSSAVNLTDPADLTRALQAGVVYSTSGSKTAGGQQVIGYVFQTPEGTTKYGVQMPDGTMRFTDTNPFTGTVVNAGDYGSGQGLSVFVPANQVKDASGAVTGYTPIVAQALNPNVDTIGALTDLTPEEQGQALDKASSALGKLGDLLKSASPDAYNAVAGIVNFFNPQGSGGGGSWGIGQQGAEAQAQAQMAAAGIGPSLAGGPVIAPPPTIKVPTLPWQTAPRENMLLPTPVSAPAIAPTVPTTPPTSGSTGSISAPITGGGSSGIGWYSTPPTSGSGGGGSWGDGSGGGGSWDTGSGGGGSWDTGSGGGGGWSDSGSSGKPKMKAV